MQNTIWSDSTKLPHFPSLKKDLNTDVLIIGGGMAGILCAYMLEQKGIDYALIEADSICQGVTGRTTAKITSQHGLIYHKLLSRFGTEKALQYWKLNQQALCEFEKLAQGIDCDFQRRDSYLYARSSAGILEKEREALQRLGIPFEFVAALPLPFPVLGAVKFPDQAQFHPGKFLAAIAAGLRIYEHTPAREILSRKVTTDRGTITASKIIVATHFPILNCHGGYFLKLYQHRSYVLALEHERDIGGMYLSEEENGISLRSNQKYLLLGGGGHRTGRKGDGWEGLEAFAAQYYPNARIRYRWAAQDCMSLDGFPYIGQYSSSTPGLYVATGFNKWGMTSSMVAARLLTERIAGNPCPEEALFSPSRSIFTQQLFKNAGEAAVSLLTPTKPRCPHMGCALKWNPQEHSWDCPCHGSRFTEDGTLLENPSTKDRKMKR